MGLKQFIMFFITGRIDDNVDDSLQNVNSAKVRSFSFPPEIVKGRSHCPP